jgi:pimeloyl-ACP methyl ester carboxylesterase
MTVAQKHSVTTADGTRLFVEDRGAGEPILLIPGLGFATWSFTKQAKQLSTIGRVITMDNRGAGRSSKPAGPYSIGQLADDAHTVLTQLDAAPAHLVGTSMGGYIGLTLALRHPEAVRSLTLIATTSGGPGSHGIPEDTLRAWRKAAPLGAAGFARATMPRSFAPGWVDEHPEEYEHLLAQRLVSPTPPEAWRAQFAACAAYLKRGAPSGPVTVPTTIIHGTADRIVPYANAIHTAHRIPHARFITLPDAGHLCWIESAALVNDLITARITPTGADGTR